jgi:hypothetical protein
MWYIFSMKVLLGLLIILATFVFLDRAFPALSPYSFGGAKPASFSLRPLEAGAIASETSTAPLFTADGVFVRDTSQGQPGTGYLLYENAKGDLMDKELLFSDSTGCDITMGHLPCVPSASEDRTGGPKTTIESIPSGSSIHVEGRENLQAVEVSSYTSLPGLPAPMATTTMSVGDTVTFSNGLVLTSNGIRSDAACVLGFGCFGDGTLRANISLALNGTTDYAELVTGRIFRTRNYAIVLTAIDTTTYTKPQLSFLVIAKKP